MKRRRWLAITVAAALPLSQLGHAFASALRHDGNPLEPGAAHRYFAADLSTALAVVAAALLGSGLVLAAARRRARGAPTRRRAAWPLLWVFLGLAALQLEIYLVQELIEGSSTIDVAWRGLAGQLPVAGLAAVVIHWLSSRLGPAIRAVRRPRWLLLRVLAAGRTHVLGLLAQLKGLPAPARGGRAPPLPV
jgi:hypothetical protein